VADIVLWATVIIATILISKLTQTRILQANKTLVEIAAILAVFQTFLAIFKFTGTQKEKFQQALNILSPPTSSSMEAKLKAQLLALWLNYMAGWTGGYKYGGKTAQQIIQGSENALTNHQTSQYEYWKNMCDGFNNIS
jgi:hypothetical protein